MVVKFAKKNVSVLNATKVYTHFLIFFLHGRKKILYFPLKAETEQSSKNFKISFFKLVLFLSLFCRIICICLGSFFTSILVNKNLAILTPFFICDDCKFLTNLKLQENSRETCISALLTTPKSLTVWITTDYGKFLKRWEYQTTWFASWEICMQVKKQQLEVDMEQQTGFK